jgi:uncharacterized tellurite resistance protein B-like protein
MTNQNNEHQLERDWNFPVSLAYIFQAFATYIDGNVSPQVTTAIKVALQEWLNGTSQSDHLDEVLETANQYLKEDANSPDGVKTIMQNFFYLGEHMNSVLPDELKNEVMRDLVNIASADADLNETEEKWIKGFGRALGVVPMSDSVLDQLKIRDLSVSPKLILYFGKKELDEFIQVDGKYWDEATLYTYTYSADLVIFWRAGSLTTHSMNLGQVVELLESKPLSEMVVSDFSDLERAPDCEYPEVHENEGVEWYFESEIDEGPDNFDHDDLIKGDITVKHQEFQFTGVQKLVIQIGDERFEINT